MENEAFRRCTGGNLVETPNASSIGSLQLSAVPNITGNITQTYGTWRSLTVDGVFKTSGTKGSKAQGENGSSTQTIMFDASLGNAAYGRDGTIEVRPTNFSAFTFIAF